MYLQKIVPKIYSVRDHRNGCTVLNSDNIMEKLSSIDNILHYYIKVNFQQTLKILLIQLKSN